MKVWALALAAMAAAGIARADDIAEKAALCAACHGDKGMPLDASIPILWGQNEGYIYLELKDMKKGARKNDQMAAAVETLSRDDMLVVSNIARYHRRGAPQKSHLPYTSLDRDARLVVSKLASILRIANALDADHLQKVKDVKVLPEEDSWILEVQGAGDMTIERLVALSRSDLFAEVFGRRIAFREAARV